MDLNNRIESIISENNLDTPLVILVGFGQESFDNWFITPIDQKLDLIDLDDRKAKVFSEAMASMAKGLPYYIVRPEEFSLISELVGVMYPKDKVVIKNDLFDTKYPYDDSLSDVQKAYEMLYLSEDTEIEGTDKLKVERINTFYGGIDYSKKSNEYYISYKTDLWDGYQVFDISGLENDVVPQLVSNPTADITMALDEEETAFLDFEIEQDYSNSVNFVIESLDQIPHRYIHRISVMKELHPDWEVYFSTQSIKRNDIERLDEYRQILKKVWGYDDFRDLEMYATIEKRDKKLIKISQAQIIDDIVQQAEQARGGNDYRDVYITASTGAGKSVMFQVPTLYLTEKYQDDKPLVLVISPLIGLMNDQVDSMKAKGVENAETINGNTPPYEKQNILQKVADGTVDMLYLSPETLQARGDIKMLIGDRKIGMVIVDEAHIVTTWGKSFRADYWYLGIYLQKLRKEFQFPIVTFTATAIYGGREDMYMDTRNSLNMVRPIAYFGVVRRNDIFMKVSSSADDKDRDYRKTKNVLALKHLQNASKRGQKSLMYFPTISLLNGFYQFIETNAPSIAKVTGRYYGTLTKEEKDAGLDEYKTGEIQFVLATKAFGMGIDIPNITNVYHFNPTGNVVDYIQEIGRVARNHQLVPRGFGVLDFLPQDLNAVKKLQGMSAIRKNQIQAVMQKVLDIYRAKGNNRNIVVNADDFKYIFSDNLDDDNNNLDNKVKTVLLMIEKDFSSSRKLGYSPFVARPRSIFGKELILATKEVQNTLESSSLRNYVEYVASLHGGNYASVLSIDLSGIWEDHYKKMSFPEFKYKLNTPDEREKLRHSKLFSLFVFASGVQYEFDDKNSTKQAKYKSIMETYLRFLDTKQRTNKQFDAKELGEFVRNNLRISDPFKARSLAQVLINATFEYQKLKDVKVLKERVVGEKTRFGVIRSGDIFYDFVSGVTNRIYHPKYSYFEDEGSMNIFHYRNSEEFSEELIVLGIGEAFELGSYTTLGGYNPQIYIRINSVYPVEQAIKADQKYRNFILEDVMLKHRIGVLMQRFLFTHKENGNSGKELVEKYTDWFWDQIEDYFMGKLPEEVETELFQKKSRADE